MKTRASSRQPNATHATPALFRAALITLALLTALAFPAPSRAADNKIAAGKFHSLYVTTDGCSPQMRIFSCEIPYETWCKICCH